MRHLVLAILTIGCGADPAHDLAVADHAGDRIEFGEEFEPPSGRVLHGWGQFSGAWTQDLESGRGDATDLAEYEASVSPASPAMLSFYVAPVPAQIAALLPKLARLKQERGRFVVLLGLYLLAFGVGRTRVFVGGPPQRPWRVGSCPRRAISADPNGSSRNPAERAPCAGRDPASPRRSIPPAGGVASRLLRSRNA